MFVGNQLIPQPAESEEDERIEEEHREEGEEEEEEKDNEVSKPEEPQVNVLRDQINALPLPESLKAYVLYYREK